MKGEEAMAKARGGQSGLRRSLNPWEAWAKQMRWGFVWGLPRVAKAMLRVAQFRVLPLDGNGGSLVPGRVL